MKLTFFDKSIKAISLGPRIPLNRIRKGDLIFWLHGGHLDNVKVEKVQDAYDGIIYASKFNFCFRKGEDNVKIINDYVVCDSGMYISANLTELIQVCGRFNPYVITLLRKEGSQKISIPNIEELDYYGLKNLLK